MATNPNAGAEPTAAAPVGARSVVLGAGSVFLVAACLARFGFEPEALVGSIFAVVLLVLASIDLERRVIPDRIVLPATAVLLALQLAFFPDQAAEWVLAGLGAALFFFVPLLVYPQGMGMGDVKLALFLGVGLGTAVVSALVVGLLLGFLAAMVILVRGGREARRQTIPFAPFLGLGGIVALFFA